jgi:hypothetical protein
LLNCHRSVLTRNDAQNLRTALYSSTGSPRSSRLLRRFCSQIANSSIDSVERSARFSYS